MNNFQRRRMAAGRREKKARAMRPRILITTDGHTEYDYLDAFLKHHGLGQAVELKPFCGIDVLTLVNETLKFAGKNASLSNFCSSFEEIWIVCDTEVEPDTTSSRRIHAARIMVAAVRPKPPHLILSSPCIEAWFLFHFGKAGFLRDGTDGKNTMIGFIPTYGTAKLGRLNYKDDLLANGREAQAIASAKRHFASTARGNPLSNPATEMWKLMERLHDVVGNSGTSASAKAGKV